MDLFESINDNDNGGIPEEILNKCQNNSGDFQNLIQLLKLENCSVM